MRHVNNASVTGCQRSPDVWEPAAKALALPAVKEAAPVLQTCGRRKAVILTQVIFLVLRKA
jgi:hypothetical protein